ncbi:MAG: endonuclease, partial [Blastocatellia bacterium]
MAASKNRYVTLIASIFLKYHQEGATEVAFRREDIVEIATLLNIALPKNLGDVIYSFRYRAALPDTIIAKAPAGYAWIIRAAGRAQYKFVLTKEANFLPNPNLVK